MNAKPNRKMTLIIVLLAAVILLIITGLVIFTRCHSKNIADSSTSASESGIGPYVLKEFVYDHSPIYTYSYLQAPCEFKTGGDDSVSPYDFAY